MRAPTVGFPCWEVSSGVVGSYDVQCSSWGSWFRAWICRRNRVGQRVQLLSPEDKVNGIDR